MVANTFVWFYPWLFNRPIVLFPFEVDVGQIGYSLVPESLNLNQRRLNDNKLFHLPHHLKRLIKECIYAYLRWLRVISFYSYECPQYISFY